MNKIGLLSMIFAASAAGLSAQVVESGYYTLSPFPQTSASQTCFTYDDNTLRPVFGNAADYDNPVGRNGEHAYLYAQTLLQTTLQARTFLLRADTAGRFTIQSCSGEAYSYLGAAAYDRRLAVLTALPTRTFSLNEYDYAATPAFGESERVMQYYKGTAFFDSLANATAPLASLTLLEALDSSRITPALRLRPAISDAKGALANWPAGDAPGYATPMLSATLSENIATAETMLSDKNLTDSAATAMISTLSAATEAYAKAAPAALNPVADGYYFIRSAYSAFEARQSKQKVLIEGTDDNAGVITWGNMSVNDGTTAFLLKSSGSDGFTITTYDGLPLLSPAADASTGTVRIPYGTQADAAVWKFESEAEGRWRFSATSLPGEWLVADGVSVGRTGLYGQPKTGLAAASASAHMFAGHCGSWILDRAYHTVTVPSTGWVGLTTSFPVEIPDGMEVYTLKIADDGQLHAVPITGKVIPACIAVLIKGTRGTYNLYSTLDGVPAETPASALVACNVPKSGLTSGSVAVLKVKDGVAGFEKATRTSVAAGSTYLPYADGDDEWRPIVVDGDPTGIQGVKLDSDDDSAPIYDTEGRRLPARPSQGVYIQGGKKKISRK